MGTDAQTSPLNLPEDPSALKRMVVLLAQERDLGERELRDRDRRIAELEQNRRQLEQARQEWEQTRRQLEQARQEWEQTRQQLEHARQQLELDKLRLEHQLAEAQRRLYGRRADKIDPHQLALECATELEGRPVDPALLVPGEPAEGAEGVRRVQPVPGRGHGRRDLSSLDHLPAVQKIHDLPEAERACPCCGTTRREIGRESNWQIEHIPASFQRIEHVRVKYGCPNCEMAGQNPQIALAEKPVAAIDKGMAGPGLLAFVGTAKFADHLPLYRLQGIFARQGLEISRSTLSVWCGDMADIAEPVYWRMVQQVLQSHVIHTDDTVLPMLAPEQTKKARLWGYLGDAEHPCNVFDFTLSRARDGPAAFLSRYGEFRGVLQADAYGGYEGICVENTLVQAGCWAHARRKFVETAGLKPAIATEAVEIIDGLFAIERRAKALTDPERLELRQTRSLEIVQGLRIKLLAWQEGLWPKHPLAQAIGYTLNQWGPLTAFLADPQIALDNNIAEQQMKRIAIGRKNYLFVGNERGGRTAAILASLTSTCQRHGIDPQVYLTQMLVNMPRAPLSELDQWLPHNWKRAQPQAQLGPAPSL